MDIIGRAHLPLLIFGFMLLLSFGWSGIDCVLALAGMKLRELLFGRPSGVI
jgi:hypothetical protein